VKWLIRLCLCLPLLAQAQTLTVKVPSRPINDLDNETCEVARRQPLVHVLAPM